MLRSHFCGLAVIVLSLFVSESRGEDEPKAAPINPVEVDQAALDKKFAEKLSGAVFAGRYSVTVGGKETPAEMEKYTISRVSKLKDKDDYWVFSTRIQYGKTDLVIPLTLQVKWAGDTPMITLTNVAIPGLGTFTSRVLIYGDRYAGTWEHGKTGGHLWGRIEKIEKPADSAGPSGKAVGSGTPDEK
jgi:hypothetical protein